MPNRLCFLAGLFYVLMPQFALAVEYATAPSPDAWLVWIGPAVFLVVGSAILIAYLSMMHIHKPKKPYSRPPRS